MTNQTGASVPRTSRTFNIELESGHKLIYIADGYITYAEAGKRIRQKFNQVGKFIK